MIEKLTAPFEVKTVRVSTTGNVNQSSIVPFSNFNGSTQIVREHEGRNEFLFGKALRLFHNGCSKPAVETEIEFLNNNVCYPPIGTIEIQKLIYSAQQRFERRQ